MALGGLVVKLALEYAQYTQGLDKADQKALSFAKNVQDSMDSANKATVNFLGGLVTGAVAAVASYETVASVIDHVRESINKLDEISKAAQRTGIASGALQELAHAGSLADVSLDGLATGAKKLSQAMLEAATGGKEQAALFKAIGVEVKNADGSLRGVTDVFGDVSDVFAGLEDGATKTALAVKLFGKSGADMIPLLNSGKDAFVESAAEAHKYGLVISGDVLKASEAFNDNLTRLGKLQQGTWNAIASGVLPVLLEYSNAAVAAASDTNSINQETQKLASDGTLTSWAKDAINALTYVADAAEGVVRVVKIVGLSIGALIASATQGVTAYQDAYSALKRGDLAGIGAALAGGAREVKSTFDQLRTDVDKALSDDLIGVKIRARVNDIKSFGAAATDADRELNRFASGAKLASDAAKKMSEARIAAALAQSKEKSAAQDVDKANNDFIETIAKMNVELDAQLAKTDKLTPAEKLLAELKANTTKKVKELTEAQRQARIVDAEALVVKEHEADIEKRRQQATSESVKARQQDIDSLGKAAASAEEQARAERELVTTFGMSKASILDRNAARLEEQATLVELQAIKRLDKDLDEQAYDLAMRQAKAIRERAAAMHDLADAERQDDAQKAAEAQAKAAYEEWKRWNDQIGQSLSDALMRGGKSAAEYLKGLFRNLVLQPIIRGVLAPFTGAAATFASGGAYAADGTGGSASSLSGLANAYSSLSNAYDYFIGGSGNNTLTGAISTAYNNFAYGSTGQSLGLSTATVGNNPSAYTASLTDTGSALGGAATTVSYAAIGQLVGRGISGGYSAWGGNSGSSAVNTGTAVGAIVGSIVPVIGTAVGALVGGIIGGVVNRAFGRKAPEVTERGITGTFNNGNFTGQGYADVVEKGGWFRSDKNYTLYNELNSDINKALDQGGAQILESVKKYTAVLGLPADKLNDVTEQFKIKVTDNADENSKAVEEALNKYANTLLGAFTDELEPFRLAGEEISKTIERVGGTLSSVNDSLSQLGVAKFDTSLAGAQNALDLSSLFGGTDQFAQLAQQFYGSFYSQAEKTQDITDKLASAFSDLGLTMPSLANGANAARESYRALVQSQDLTTESGKQTFAALLQLSGIFDAAAQSADELAKKIQGTNFDLELELLQALGKDSEALALQRQKELDALREIEAATGVAAGTFTDLKEQIYAAVDAAKAAAQQQQIMSKLDGVIADFLSGSELATYRAGRIKDTLAKGGIDSSIEGIIGATKDQIRDLWNAVGPEGKDAILEAYGSWKALEQALADDQIAALIDGIASSADDLMSAYNEINPAADNLVESWRKNKSAMDELKGALDEIAGTKAKSAIDTLRDTIAARDALASAVDANNEQILQLKAGQGGQKAVDALRQRERELLAEFNQTGSSQAAQALTRITLQRIQAEGKVQEEAQQKLNDAAYKANLDAFNLQKAQYDAQKQAAQDQIDAAKRIQDLAKGVPQFLGSLRAGNLSNLSYTGRLDQQKALFEDSLKTGVDPQSQLTAYLQQAQQLYGGATAQYSAIFTQALAQYQSAIQEQAAKAPDTIAIAQAQLDALDAVAPKLETAIVDTSDAQIAALESLNELFDGRISSLNDQIDTQTKLLQDQLKKLTDTVTNQEAQITQAGEAYKQIIEQLQKLVGLAKTTTSDAGLTRVFEGGGP